MSVNIFPENICLTPAELFLLIQIDRSLWKLCEKIEEESPKLQELPAKRLAATFNIQMGLATKSTRGEIIKEVVNLGYKESYAEKLVDGVIAIFKDLLGSGRDMPLHITAEPKPVKKGRFGEPYSRWEQDRGEPPKPGRPPLEYGIEEHPKVKLDERMKKLIDLTTLLSGSSLRYLKLRIKIFFKMMERPEEREFLLNLFEKIGEVYSNIYPELSDKTEEIKNRIKELGEVITTKKEDLEKRMEEWINNDYRELMEPVWKDAMRILGLEPSTEGKQ
jgi:hypothetical protein